MTRPARLLVALLVALPLACSEAGPESGPGDGGAADPAGGDSLVVWALGQEPGWHVEVFPDGRMRAVIDYGTDTLTGPVAVVDSAPDVYRLVGGESVVELVVEAEPCRDAMSAKPFPATATLRIGDRRLDGCARPR